MFPHLSSYIPHYLCLPIYPYTSPYVYISPTNLMCPHLWQCVPTYPYVSPPFPKYPPLFVNITTYLGIYPLLSLYILT